MTEEIKDNGLDSERLKSLRKKRGISVSEIHTFLGIARSSYAGYEAGVRVPPPEKFKKIVSYLDTSADYLMGISDDEKPIEIQIDNLKELLKNDNLHWDGKQLTEEQREQLSNLISAFTSSNNKKD